MPDSREMEERRFSAIQALNATVECLQATNPQSLFLDAKGNTVLDTTKVQSMCNRWADQASDVLLQALELASAIGTDALSLFPHHHSSGPAGVVKSA